MDVMTAEPNRGFHLLEEPAWEETAVLPKIRIAEFPASQPTPVMPDDEDVVRP